MEQAKSSSHDATGRVLHGTDSHTGCSGVGDFWTRYDKFADGKDKDLAENLNRNLDVLLIFVSVFRASLSSLEES